MDVFLNLSTLLLRQALPLNLELAKSVDRYKEETLILSTVCSDRSEACNDSKTSWPAVSWQSH